MCGIAGWIRFDGRPVDEGILRRMTDSLAHRGPDDSGIMVRNRDEVSVGLGHRRLSIIDLSPAGHQPMANEKEDVWIVYNGEVYNFPELRKELEPRHSFRSRTDTEVILHLYEEKGEDCLVHLNGMFALAVWDEGNRRLTLARDRMGKKPLYYAVFPGEVIFASELKALLFHPRVKREIDPAALGRYLAFEYVPAPHSIIQGVKKIPPGSCLTFSREEKDPAPRPYWEINFDGRERFRGPVDEVQVGAELCARLSGAVERRLVSDVPLGVFLSGGIDSSAVLALMCRRRNPREIKTFTIGFREKSFDESGYGRRVARFFRTDHHEEILDPARMLEIFPEVAGFLDEPFADASIIPTYLLSRFTRATVTVALGGDGGDELFSGYPTFPAHRLARFLDHFPAILHRGLERAARYLPVSMDNLSFDFKVKQFLKGLPYPPGIRNQVWLGSFSPEEQNRLLTGDFRKASGVNDPYEGIRELINRAGARDLWDLVTRLYTRFYLADDILTKVDRASMAVSLEVRAPFLDPSVVAFANSLPAEKKMRGFQTKYILKQALRGIIPAEILSRGKKGFGIPVAFWLRRELKGLMLELLDPGKIGREGIFNPSFISRLVGEHLGGKKDNRKQLWTLIMFELWRKNYLKG